jgi:CheY-like chemotaxis protein
LAVLPQLSDRTGPDTKLIAGRKLLLADDSAAVQKVIELTFADEGMEVFSVGDGHAALQRLESVTPDVVLADAFMPGLNGYELCRSMKDDQRFAQIPVMLLISSFAPFDEAEAQRAGADDIMTKPFQSIRQLINRVDSLLTEKRPVAENLEDQSMAELTHAETEATQVPVRVEQPMQVEQEEPHVTVLVEAAQMEAALPHEEAGGAWSPDIETQTADTARLEHPALDLRAEENKDVTNIEPPFDEAPIAAQFGDPTPPEMKSEIPMNETVSVNQLRRPPVSDALLDLDETDFAASAIADDVVLELDLDEPATVNYEQPSWDLTPSQETEQVVPDAVVDYEPSWDLTPSHDAEQVEPEAVETAELFTNDEQVVLPEVSDEPESLNEAQSAAAEDVPTGSLASAPGTGSTQQELSPEAINAIAQRVIEQMSDKVIREIAWEVVPELSELMIKKKLDQS